MFVDFVDINLVRGSDLADASNTSLSGGAEIAFIDLTVAVIIDSVAHFWCGGAVKFALSSDTNL